MVNEIIFRFINKQAQKNESVEYTPRHFCPGVGTRHPGELEGILYTTRLYMSGEILQVELNLGHKFELLKMFFSSIF